MSHVETFSHSRYRHHLSNERVRHITWLVKETGEKGKDSLRVPPTETFNYEKYGRIKMEKSKKTASGVRNMIDLFSNGELKYQLRKYYQDSKKKKKSQ